MRKNKKLISITFLCISLLLCIFGAIKYTSLKDNYNSLSKTTYYNFKNNLYTLLTNEDLNVAGQHILRDALVTSYLALSDTLSLNNSDHKELSEFLSPLPSNLKNVKIESLSKSAALEFLDKYYNDPNSNNLSYKQHILIEKSNYFSDLQTLFSKGSF